MITQDLGIATAYGYAKSKGYTGTEAEFAELMASYAEVGQTAVTAAQTATTKASEAATSATTATTKASEAASSATTATTKAGEASTSASTATSAKDTAVSASQTATAKATEATTAAATAVSAKDDAVSANTAAQSAKTAAQTAQTGAETAAASVSASAAQIQTNADDISELKEDTTQLKSDLDAVTESEEAVIEVAKKQSGTTTLPDGVSTTRGCLRGMTVSNPGNLTSTTSEKANTYSLIADSDMDVFVEIEQKGGTTQIGIFETQPYGTAYRVSPIYASNNAEYPMPTAENPLSVTAGQYITFSSYNGHVLIDATWELYKIGKGETHIKSSEPLTHTMDSEVDGKIEVVATRLENRIDDIGDKTAIATDALLYVDKLPAYYIEPSQDPTSYAEAVPYMEYKIAQIPSNNSFLFITDTHWFGNQKHSTYLMDYVRKRTGIEYVLFGGDAYGYADTKYLAVRVLGQYLYQNRQAFFDKFIPCVGDHDNNTGHGEDSEINFVPYSEQAKLFVGDLEKTYTCYAPSEKLATMATGDTYDEVMAFFKTVYYVDDDVNKTRFIVLNCGNGSGYGPLYTVFGTTGIDILRTQIPFLIESLYSTPKGYNVCILSHKLEFGGTAPNAITALLSGFKMKSNYVKPSPSSSGNANIESFWAYTTSYDFSDAPDVGFIFSVSGHTHTDIIKWCGYTEPGGSISRWNTYNGETLDQSVLGQIPYITTATDSSGNVDDESISMINGTVTEQCFDIVSILSDGLALTRIGAGNNRRIYMSE